MAYINSANVKFPKADLIIEEDGSGNVVGLYDRTTDYVYPTPATTATVVVNNNTTGGRVVYGVGVVSGHLTTINTGTISANGSRTASPVIGTMLLSQSNYTFEVVSGDFELIDANHLLVLSSGEVNVIDA